MSTLGNSTSFGGALAASAHLLADEEHRRFIALPFPDDDGAVDRHRVEALPHRLDGDLVGLVTVPLPHGVRAGDGGLFDDRQEVEREIRIRNHDLIGGSSHRVALSCRKPST